MEEHTTKKELALAKKCLKDLLETFSQEELDQFLYGFSVQEKTFDKDGNVVNVKRVDPKDIHKEK